MGDVLRKGKGWYIRFIDTDGRRKCRASHQPTKDLARRYLVEVEARVARGNVGMPERAPAAPTVEKLCARFLGEYSRPKIKDPARYRLFARSALQRVLPLIGKRAADVVQPGDVARLRDTLAGTLAPGTVRVTLSFLAAVYSWAVKQDIVKTNPVKGVERPAASSSIDFYHREEVAALFRVAAERAAVGELADRLLMSCVHLAVHTGLRKGELLGLRWQDVDFETQRLTVARSFQTATKSNRVRHLRLPSVCIPWLRDWRGGCPVTPEGLVFPLQKNLLDDRTAALLLAARIRVPAHPFHAMRHTFASHFIMAGGNILTLQRILGHSDVKMTLIYAHLAPDFLGAEMERVKF